MKKIFRKKLLAFSLLELIVVITILAILWTISFFNLNWYISNSRDVVRLESIKNIDFSIELFSVEKWFFPKPTDGVDITYSWATLWTQWSFWDDNFANVQKLSKKPVDVLTSSDFSYSVSNDGREYEIWAVMEWDFLAQNKFISSTFAIWNVPARSLVMWEYNWKVLKTSTWWVAYILTIPTLLSYDISETDITKLIDKQTLAYKWFWNLPATYSGTIFKIDGWFEFDPNMLVIYSWDFSDLTNNENTWVTLLQNLQNSYSWTVLDWNPNFNELLSIDISDDWSSKEAKIFSYELVKNILKVNTPITITYWENWLTYDLSNILIDADTRSITQDSLWNLWFATKNWVSKFQWNIWVNYLESDWLADKDVRSVIQDASWNMWFATNKWVNEYDPISDIWTTYVKQDGLVDDDVVSIIQDDSWDLWFSTKKWVSNYDITTDTWTNYDEADGLVNKIVTSSTEDSLWNIWFSTIDWVSKYDPIADIWTNYNETDGLADKSVLSIYSDDIWNVWFGTINGASKYNVITDTWTNYNESDGLIDKFVQFIFEDIDGTMWFGTPSWISEFDWSNWNTFTTEDGLADNDVQVIYQDDAWNMWFGTKKWVTIYYK